MRALLIILFLSFCTTSFTQIFKSQLVDIDTKEKISDAFIFISNSSKSTVSNSIGKFTIDRTALINSDVVISHLNYETKYFLSKEILSVADTIYMTPVPHNIQEVILVSKGSKKRKKWLKRFTKSLLGNTDNASKSKLLNPEAILFQEIDGSLKAQTSDYLIFKNENLGYKLWFLLKDYSLEKDNDVLYTGKVFFEDFETLEPQQLENRRIVFERSSRKFFKDYTFEIYDSLQYGIALASLESEGYLHYISDIKRDNLFSPSLETEFYELKFPRFLRIENKAIEAKQKNQSANLGFGTPGFNDIARKKKSIGNIDRSNYAVSYFSSRSNKIILNKEGIIQNQKDIEEYGYWSELRLADILPHDYEYIPLRQE